MQKANDRGNPVICHSFLGTVAKSKNPHLQCIRDGSFDSERLPLPQDDKGNTPTCCRGVVGWRISNSQRGLQSKPGDEHRWGTARAPWCQQPGGRSCGTPKP